MTLRNYEALAPADADTAPLQTFGIVLVIRRKAQVMTARDRRLHSDTFTEDGCFGKASSRRVLCEPRRYRNELVLLLNTGAIII